MNLETIKKRDGYLVVGFLDISQGEVCIVPENFGSFNVVIEAFWVNYPFCYVNDRMSGISDCTANIACAYPLSLDPKYKDWKSIDYNDGVCKGFGGARPVVTPEAPSFKFDTIFPDELPIDSNVVPFQRSKDSVNFYKDLFDYDDDTINNNSLAHAVFFNSFHTASSRNTRLFLKNKTVIKIASIGGWYMGGSVAGEIQGGDTAGRFNNWAVCLENIPQFIQALEGIVSLGYDGIDFDCETVFAGDAAGLSSLNCSNLVSEGCYGNNGLGDSSQTVSKFVDLLNAFRRSSILNKKILSLSPRATDVLNPGARAPVGFFGQIFEQTGSIDIDMLNLQFYNDREDVTVGGGTGVGVNVRPILSYIKTNWPGIKNVQVGVVARSESGSCDSNNPIYCITSEQMNNFWFDNADPLKKYADGMMTWGITTYGPGSIYKRGDGCDIFSKLPISDNNWLKVSRPPCLLARAAAAQPAPTQPKSSLWLVAALVVMFLGIILMSTNLYTSVIIFTTGMIMFLLAIFLRDKQVDCSSKYKLIDNKCVPSCDGQLTLSACQVSKTYGCLNGECQPMVGGTGCKNCALPTKYNCSIIGDAPVCVQNSNGEFSSCPAEVLYSRDQTGTCVGKCGDVAISKETCENASVPCAATCTRAASPTAGKAGDKCSSPEQCGTGLICQQTNQCGNMKDDAEYNYNLSTYLCRKDNNDCFKPLP